MKLAGQAPAPGSFEFRQSGSCRWQRRDGNTELVTRMFLSNAPPVCCRSAPFAALPAIAAELHLAAFRIGHPVRHDLPVVAVAVAVAVTGGGLARTRMADFVESLDQPKPTICAAWCTESCAGAEPLNAKTGLQLDLFTRIPS